MNFIFYLAEEALDKNARVAPTSKKNFEEDQDAPLLT